MSGEGHKFLYFDPGKTGEFMEKESFPSNVEFNTADLGAEQPAGDASFETFTEDAASEAPIAETPSEIDIVKGAMAEESGDDIDKIINQSEKAPEKSLVKKALALALAGSALIGAGCDKDKNKNTSSTADPTAGTPKTESVSTVTDTSDKQNASSVDVSANAPLSNAPTSETETSATETEKSGKHVVVTKAEGQTHDDVVLFNSDSVEVVPGLDYKDSMTKDPLDSSGEALDIDAFFAAMGVNPDSISKQIDGSPCVALGNREKDKVAATITRQQINYYVDGKVRYIYSWNGSGMAQDGVAICIRDEAGDPEYIFDMHEADVIKALEVVGRAYASGKTSVLFEVGEA